MQMTNVVLEDENLKKKKNEKLDLLWVYYTIQMWWLNLIST